MADEWWLLQSFGPMLAALATMVVLFVPWRTFARVKAAPADILAHLALRMRSLRFRVQESDGVLTVRLGRYAAARIRARPQGEGSTALQVQAYATNSGWGTVILLIFLWLGAFADLLLMAYLWRRARDFAREDVRSLLPEDGPLKAPPAEEEIRRALLNTLAEAYRIAAETRDARRSDYWDSMGVVLLGALAVWAVVLMSLLWPGVSLLGPDFDTRLRWAFSLAAAAALGSALPAVWALRRRFLRASRPLDAWVARLSTALSHEAAGALDADGAPSRFELLAEVSLQLPKWTAILQRSPVGRGPFAGFAELAIVLGGFTAISLVLGLWSYAVSTGGDLTLALVSTAALAIALWWGVRAYRWQRGREELQAKKGAEEWSARFEALREKMQGFLEGL
jgi:hypothetical protein